MKSIGAGVIVKTIAEGPGIKGPGAVVRLIPVRRLLRFIARKRVTIIILITIRLSYAEAANS